MWNQPKVQELANSYCCWLDYSYIRTQKPVSLKYTLAQTVEAYNSSSAINMNL